MLEWCLLGFGISWLSYNGDDRLFGFYLDTVAWSYRIREKPFIDGLVR